MATKFLRKIILEELKNVLNEQAGLEVWKSASPEIPGVEPGQTFTPIPDDMPKAQQTSLTPAQKYRNSIKNLQRELKRLGIFKAELTGKPDVYTEESVSVVYPGANVKNAINTKEKVDRLVGFLKNKPESYGAAAIASKRNKAQNLASATYDKFPQGEHPIDVAPEDLKVREKSAGKKLDVFRQGLGSKEYQQESIAREIEKLLKKI